MNDAAQDTWTTGARPATANSAATVLVRPSLPILVQRIGFGALALLIVFTVFLADIAIARRFEPLSQLTEERASEAIGSSSLPSWTEPLQDLIRRGSVVPLFTLLVMLGGAVEFVRLARHRGAKPLAGVIYLSVAVLILLPWLSSAGWLGQRPVDVEGIYWQLIGVVGACVGIACLTVLRSKPDNVFRDVGASLTIILFIGLLGSFATQLRCSRDISAQEGAWLLLIVVFVTKSSDIGAYFAGSAFGWHKLAPAISPGKSVEGAIGGVAMSALVAGGIAWSGVSDTFRVSGGAGPGFESLWPPILFGAILAISAEFGDLFESCFKREAGSKDSGHLFPRFGGILDLLDSLLPSLPLGWFMLTGVWDVV